MGIVRTEDSRRAEFEEFRRMLLETAAVHRRKGQEEEEEGNRRKRIGLREIDDDDDDDDGEGKMVCVTSGVSFLGLAIVNQLLVRGYSVRVIVHNEEEVEKLREMETSGVMRGANNNARAVMANLNEAQSLVDAFDGCRGVFHTSSLADPAGLSGYSKWMAEIEVKASENVLEACARTPSVRKCVLTSSLLACIWRDRSLSDLSSVINHDCWSDESICIEKKLWYALGKLKAEKTAWRVAEQRGLKLTTICPGLITGPEFCRRNSTPTIAYLKGAQDMYADGLLATVDVIKLAEAHVCVYEAMGNTASGRYICFDRVIRREDEVENLAQEIGMLTNRISENAPQELMTTRFELSNRKLSSLMLSTMRRCYNERVHARDGLMVATIDSIRLAKAHVCVYEAMNNTAFGRFILLDRVIAREDEVEALAQEIGISRNALGDFTTQFELSNWKLSSLMSKTMQHRYNADCNS